MIEISPIRCHWWAPILRAVKALTILVKRMMQGIFKILISYKSFLRNLLELIPYKLHVDPIVVGLEHVHEFLCFMSVYK